MQMIMLVTFLDLKRLLQNHAFLLRVNLKLFVSKEVNIFIILDPGYRVDVLGLKFTIAERFNIVYRVGLVRYKFVLVTAVVDYLNATTMGVRMRVFT